MKSSRVRHAKMYPASAFDVTNIHFSPIYDPTLHLVMHADGPFDQSAMEIAVEATGTMAPILASHYSEGGNRGYWQSGMGEKPAFSVHDICGENDTNHLPLVSIDPFAGPQMDVRLCRNTDAGEGGGDVLIISGHHGAMDANGLFQAAALCADAYRRVCTGKPPHFQGPSWDSRGTDAISAQFSAEELDAAYIRESLPVDTWSFPCHDGPCGSPVWDSCTIKADDVTLLCTAGKASGMTINDKIMAAYFCALFTVCGDAYANAPQLGITGAMDLRRYLSVLPSRSISNLSVAYDISLSPSCCQGMNTALPAVSQAMQSRKERYFGVGGVVLYERLYAGGVSAVKTFMNSVKKECCLAGLMNPFMSNIGIIPPSAAAFQYGEDGVPLEVTKAYLTSRETYPPGIGAYISTFSGEMTVSIPFCTGAHDPQTIRSLCEAMHRYLLEDASLV